MTWLDTAITVGVIGFMILLVWSKMENQRMIDTIMEIKEIFTKLAGNEA